MAGSVIYIHNYTVSDYSITTGSNNIIKLYTNYALLIKE